VEKLFRTRSNVRPKQCDAWIRILDHVSCRPVLTEFSRHQPIFYGRRQNAEPFRVTERAAATFADAASESP
jgi:hypothetical protein